MYSWIKLQLRRPVANSLIGLSLVLCGWLGWYFMPVAPLPQIDLPIFLVITSVPGADAKNAAQAVSAPLERAFSSIAGVKEINSMNYANISNVVVVFDFNKDAALAVLEIQGAINNVMPALPSSVTTRPQVHRFTSDDDPISFLTLSSQQLTKQQLYAYASKQIVPQFASLNGVSKVSIAGASAPALRIQLQTQALEQYALSVAQVQSMLSEALQEYPLGSIQKQTSSWLISFQGIAPNSHELESLVLKTNQTAQLRLGDIAKVELASQNPDVASFYNDADTIIIEIMRKNNTNVLETAQQIHSKLQLLQHQLPMDTQLNSVLDRSLGIKSDIKEAYRTLFFSYFLVIVVIVVFLGDWRSAILPVVVVSLTLCGSLALMYLLGFAINIMSIMALIISIGLIVDDVIVMLENMQKHLEHGENIVRAILHASKEMVWTLFTISLCLVMVFLASVADVAVLRLLFQDFTLTLALVVAVSLIVTVTFTPGLALVNLRLNPKTNRNSKYWLATWLYQLKISYGHSLYWVLRHKYLVLISLPLSFILSIAILIVLPKIGMPTQDSGLLFAEMETERSMPFAAKQEKLNLYRKQILQDKAVASIAGVIGAEEPNKASILIQLKPKAQRELTSEQMAQRIKQSIIAPAGVVFNVQVLQDLNFGSPSWTRAPFEILIRSESEQLAQQWVSSIAQDLRKIAQLADVQDSEDSDNYETSLTINRDSMAQLRINTEDVANLINNALNRTAAIGEIYYQQNQYEVIAELPKNDLQNTQQLHNLAVIAADGRKIPLQQVVDINCVKQSLGIHRSNMFNIKSIGFDMAKNTTSEQVKQAVEHYISQLAIPTEVSVEFKSPEDIDDKDSNAQVYMLVLAIMMVYWCLGMVYESFLQPLTILSIIPAALLGGLCALFITATPFSIMAFLGMFLLVGMVLRNSILMVDFINKRRRNQELSQEFIIEAALERFRPILMTNIAGICAVIPLALAFGEGSQLRQPIGIVIIGGLLLGQLLTLYTIPAMYLALDTIKVKLYAIIKKITKKIIR